MDFTKFVSLLDKEALFFARIDKLGDPFEGSLTKEHLSRNRERFNNSPEAMERVAKSYKEIRAFTLASCWHWSQHESAAMWRLYSTEREGIAIKTSFDAFSRSFTCRENIYIGLVSYVDYDSGVFPEETLFNFYMHKRQSFEHEKEVRALNYLILGEGWHRYEPGTQPPFEVGTYLAVDIPTMIQEVVVAPYAPDWFTELVRSTAGRHHLRAPVTLSSLADDPMWG